MAYHLEADEAISDGLKRIIVECVDQAINDLGDPSIDRDEGVHSARKKFKRIRAALRLVRDEIGQDIYKRENICFRDCAQLLAGARDSFVLVETLDALTDYYAPQLPPHAFAGVREELLNRYHTISRQALHESAAVEKVATRLQKTRKRILAWPIKGQDFSALHKGLRRVYKGGRRAMSRAYADLQVETFHEWWKQVKYLWYHLEILEMVWPTLLVDLACELHQLSDYLGNDHDLAELRRILTENPQLVSDKREALALVTLIDLRRSELEMIARPLGERIYYDKPQAFVKRMAAYWEIWQNESDLKVRENLKADMRLSKTGQLMVEEACRSPKEIRDYF